MHATKIYLSDEAFKKFIEDNKGKSLKDVKRKSRPDRMIDV